MQLDFKLNQKIFLGQTPERLPAEALRHFAEEAYFSVMQPMASSRDMDLQAFSSFLYWVGIR